MNIELSLGFEDVAIKQKKSIVKSRLEVCIDSEVIKGISRRIPMIASNMSTVCDADFCIQLYENGALGILHRAMPDEEIVNQIGQISKRCDIVAGSIGIGGSQFELATRMVRAGCNVLTIDVAHGYCDEVIDLAKKIKRFSKDTKVVVGNTVNIGLMEELADVADAVKVGIAQGLACETKNTAGCTEKQFSAVLKFKNISKQLGIPVISDGGIREPADFTKAIAAGASSVMAGSVFCRCPESAGETLIGDDGKLYKRYAGMASRFVQQQWRGMKAGTCPEGTVKLLPIGENLNSLLERYSGALKSGISYAGGKDVDSFQKNVEFVRFK